MKTLRFHPVIFIVSFLIVVSTGDVWGTGPIPLPRPADKGISPAPIPDPKGTISRIEGNKVTLTPENDRTKTIVLEVSDTKGFKKGDRVTVHKGKLMRIEQKGAIPEPIPQPAERK